MDETVVSVVEMFSEMEMEKGKPIKKNKNREKGRWQNGTEGDWSLRLLLMNNAG